MKTIRFFFALTVLLIGLNSCQHNAGDFTSEELKLIESCDSIMRVLTIEDSCDLKILRTQSFDLSDKAIRSKEFSRLSELMIATVTHPSQDGVGIAGPQVGLNRRVVAVQRFDKKVVTDDGSATYPFEVYPNIRIVWRSDSLSYGPEGCLSVPGRRADVLRSNEIVIEYTKSAAPVSQQLPIVRDTIKGFTAVIFQHEIDHLDGILYIDRL